MDSSQTQSHVIFPGSYAHDGATGATTTDHLRWIAKRIESGEVVGQALTEACRGQVQQICNQGARRLSPLSWRVFAERAAGDSPEVIRLLNLASYLLDRLVSFGVEPGTAIELLQTADALDCVMDDAPRHSRERLRWLCVDIADRLEHETLDTDFGHISPRIEEAAALAVLLEFEYVPIQRTSYDRDGKSEVTPAIGRTYGAPLHWNTFRHRHREFAYVFGYRFHDPAGSFPMDLFLSALADDERPDKPMLYDSWEDRNLVPARKEAIKILKRWISAIDGMVRLVPKTLESSIQLSKVVGSTGTDDSKALIDPRQSAARAELQLRFEGGVLEFFTDSVKLCGVVICSGPRSRSKRVVLDLLAKQRLDGSFVAYSGDDLEAKAIENGAKGTAARWIQDLRDDIMEALRNQANIISGHKDVILSGGPGYRFAQCISVQYASSSGITDITDTQDECDVPNADVRDVFDVRDDEAERRRTWILQQLASGVRLKAPNVAERFKRSKKTAQRDLDSLRDEGKIEFVGDPRTGYYQLCEPPRATGKSG